MRDLDEGLGLPLLLSLSMRGRAEGHLLHHRRVMVSQTESQLGVGLAHGDGLDGTEDGEGDNIPHLRIEEFLTRCMASGGGGGRRRR
jgi:hypothetical protein